MPLTKINIKEYIYIYMNKKFCFYFILLSFFYSFFAKSTFAEIPFTNSYATLSNSRFSFVSGIGVTVPAGTTSINISGTTYPDTNTGNLFPKDTICITNPGSSTCKYSGTVNSIIDSNNFGFIAASTAAFAVNDRIIVAQSPTITVTIVPNTYVPSGGYIRTTIKGSGASTNADSVPDNTGFDSGSLTTGNINSYISPTNFTKSASTLTSSSGDHVILMTLSSALSIGSTYSFTIGSGTTAAYRFINPAPYGTTGINHTRGVGEPYSITIQTENASGAILDKNITKVIPNDGILVSATVEMTLSYTIAGLGTGSSACGVAMPVTTTASAVPFGSITSYTSFYNAAQSHTVTTNAGNGYVLTVQEDGPLTENGDIGTGATIPDTLCDRSPNCNTGVGGTAAWATATSHDGFGYSMANISGTDAAFTYTNGWKPFSTSPVTIMSKTSPVVGSSAYTCYRLAVSSTQPAGYYFNKLTYVATPRF